VSLPNRAVLFGVSVATLLDVTVRAEDSGLVDSMWVGDNFFSQPRIESMVLLSAMAAQTERVRLGTLCLATFPMRHPLAFAVQWAGLDMLSGGRTTLGVCNGHSGREGAVFAQELKAMGVRSQDRSARVEEGIEVLRKAWTGLPVQHRGRFYEIDGVTCLPTPVQPRVPILIALSTGASGSPEDVASEERMLRRIGRLADGWQTGPRTPEMFRSQWARVLGYADEYGRKDELRQSVIHFRVNINEDAEQARRDATEFTARYYGDTLAPEILEMSNRSLVCGPPEAIVERVAGFLEAGLTTPVFGFMAMDQARQLELCLESVLPALRALSARADRAERAS
jgi:alkanesulfonate monooxygenase SsuD/methylene tetrahydromethanopterin reductase-like flavin-dependent oxidoreductase (luciferase family)